MKRILRWGIAAFWLLALLAPGTAQAQAGTLAVTARCLPNPEVVTVRNETGSPLTVQRISSSGDPVVDGEPIDVGARLPSAAVIPNNQTVVYEIGPNAAGNVLLNAEIFNDARLADERLILTTDRGSFEVPCGSGTNTQTFTVGGATTPGGPAVPGMIGTAVAPVQATASSAQATSAAAAATVGSAAAPVQSIAGTVVAPAQATIARGVQSGTGNVATVIPPQIATGPNVQAPSFGGAQIAPTATPASPVARQTATGSISGMVFNDLNRNGVLDAGEEGIGNVTINLRAPGPDNQSGTPDDLQVATTVTGGDGRYGYVGVTPGPYAVVEIDPPGAVSTTNNSVPVTVGTAATVVNFGDYLEPRAGAAPAQAGGVSPWLLLPVGGLLMAAGWVFSRRPKPRLAD